MNPIDSAAQANDEATSPERAPDLAGEGADASPASPPAGEKAEDEQTLARIEHLPRDVGWMMVYVGILGLVLPGVIGTPFLVAGIAVLSPGGPKMLTRWAGRKPSGFVHASLKQIGRWLDDVECRYPRLPSAS